jgi:hypothetical protein
MEGRPRFAAAWMIVARLLLKKESAVTTTPKVGIAPADVELAKEALPALSH